jgi:hypothetical protein
MYISNQLLRVTYEERLRNAETRRLIREAKAASRTARRPRRRPA